MEKKFYIKVISIVVLISMVLLVGGCVDYFESDKEKITIVDSTGNEVEINYPVENVVTLTSDSAEAVRALDAENKIVGISEYMVGDSFWGDIGEKNSIGTIFSPNVEEIASLEPKPDIVITYTDWSEDLEDDLKPFGIDVVRLDFYKMDKMEEEIELLGEILDKENEATELLNFYNKHLDEIKDLSSNLNASDVKEVYIEGYQEWSTAATNETNYHQIIELVGAKNIAEEFDTTYPKVSDEWVLEKNPDVMVKIVQDSNTLGYEVNSTEKAEQMYEEIVDRKGLSNTTAIQDDELILVSQNVLSTMQNPIGALIIADFIYPNIFEDIDPEEVHKEYLMKFHGIEHEGIWHYIQ
ncbi:ABC transporter substrate-binding protein [Methanonatronarchaeum sp. AMET-Sl]|uniref:ABC transporter substrate-binding protein n=1 Tax=Methanonatronarchaeum sp. AMET-Sl TaxID=3037654 RepID=UPI00244DAFC7|nr:ABC transporter substrate-binding protein [Methanonatronarchaeum sp. AMET-Sl]WGI18135.1 ABC transporter substrate-binding protein [Methanonatronarchaeum sp. AMET-Sl]